MVRKLKRVWDEKGTAFSIFDLDNYTPVSIAMESGTMKMLVLKMDKQGGFPAMWFFYPEKNVANNDAWNQRFTGHFTSFIQNSLFLYMPGRRQDWRAPHSRIETWCTIDTLCQSSLGSASNLLSSCCLHFKQLTWTKRSFKSIERKSIDSMTRNTQIVFGRHCFFDVRPKNI